MTASEWVAYLRECKAESEANKRIEGPVGFGYTMTENARREETQREAIEREKREHQEAGERFGQWCE